MLIKVKNISYSYFIFALFILIIASFFNMRAMEHGTEYSVFTRIAMALALLVWAFSAAKLFLPNYKLYLPPTTIILFCVYFLWASIPTLLDDKTQTGDYITNIMYIFTPMFVLVSSFNSAMHTDFERFDKFVFMILLLALAIQYVLIFKEVNFFLTNHLASSYYVLYALPLVLLFESKWIKLFAIIIVTIILFSSFKRSGVLALAVSLVVYIMISQFVKKKLKPASVLTAIALIAIAGVAFYFLATDNSNGNTILDRFENVDQDQGSGRIPLWEQTIRMIEDQDLSNQIIGNGFNTVLRESTLQLSAHNDFLETAYDFGIIGLLIYIGAFFTLFFVVFKMIRKKSRYAPSIAMLAVIYAIQSMTSHVIIYYWANVFMLSFGYMIGKFQKDETYPEDNI